MANWSNPLLTSTYTNFLTEVKDRDTDLALQFDGTTSSNIPTGAIRWNSSVNRWQKWSGSAWGELTSTYALTGLSTTGNASIGGTLGSGAITSTGSVSGTALIPTGSTVPATGVYLPSTNTIGLATSSTGRVFIDAAGEMGIGTATPGTALDIASPAGSATVGNIRIFVSGQARYHLYNGGGQAEWLFGQKTNTDHSFKLSKSVAGSETDFLTVDTSGRVGVGTTSPSAGIDVVADGTTNGMTLKLTAPDTAQGRRATLSLYSTFEGTADNGPRRTADVVAGFNGGAWGSEFLSVGVGRNGASNDAQERTLERLRINGSGNLGVGTSAPYSRFTVVPASTPSTPATANQITVGEATANSAYRLQLGYLYDTLGRGSIQAYDNNNPSPLILNGAGGYVGVGTATPATILQVNGNPPSTESGNIYIANSGQARYRLYNGGGQAEWLFGQKTGTDHAFKLSKMVGGAESDYLTVTTTGLVGVGITSPSHALDVSGSIRSVSGSNEIFINGSEAAVELSRSDSAAYIDFKTSSAEDFDCRIQQASNGLAFQTGGNGATGERLRIDSSGRVGIGTSSPQATLNVAGQIRIDNNTTDPNDGSSYLFQTSGIGWTIASTNVSINTGASGSRQERLRIDSSGRVGIGTSSPSEPLSISASSNAFISITNSTAAKTNYIGTNSSGDLDLNGNGSQIILFKTAGTERLRITSSGRLGLGNTNPVTSFDLALPAPSATIGNIRIEPSTPGQARFHLYNGGSVAGWLFGQVNSTSHDFTFHSSVAGSETERLRIGTAGQIGIAGANYGTSGQVLTSNGSGSAPSWQSSFKTVAWVNFNGTGTVAIRASGNVSSITDNFVGQYTVNFTSAIADTNYAALVSAVDVVAARPHSYATGSVGVYTYDTSNFVDSATVSVAITR